MHEKSEQEKTKFKKTEPEKTNHEKTMNEKTEHEKTKYENSEREKSKHEKPMQGKRTFSPAESRQRLRARQREFLEQCMTSSQTLAEVMEDFQLTTRRLASWIDQRWFRRELKRMVKALRRVREIEITLGSSRAASMLGRGVNNTLASPKDLHRQACVDMIKLARDLEAHERARQQRQTPPGRPDPATIVHPDVPEEQRDELIEELEK